MVRGCVCEGLGFVPPAVVVLVTCLGVGFTAFHLLSCWDPTAVLFEYQHVAVLLEIPAVHRGLAGSPSLACLLPFPVTSVLVFWLFFPCCVLSRSANARACTVFPSITQKVAFCPDAPLHFVFSTSGTSENQSVCSESSLALGTTWHFSV